MRIFLCFAFCALSLAAFSQAGSPLPGFGTGGIVTHSISASGYDVGRVVAVQDDGKIIVAGRYGESNVFAMARYNTDGSPDTDFNGNGFVIDFAFGEASAVAIQDDGKILAVSPGVNFNIARYNTNGTLDNTFGGGGRVTTSIGSGASSAVDLAIQPDGKIVVAGSSSNGSNTDFTVVRYTSTGVLDNSFDTDGIRTTDIGAINNTASAVAIQQDGKILVAGTASNSFAIVRYHSNGSIDSDLDNDGIVTTSFGSNVEARDLAMYPGGGFVVAGYTMSPYRFALAKYNPDGSPDNGFDSDGQVITNISGSGDFAYAVGVQSDGKIVAGGRSFNNGVSVVAVRYTSSGALDNSFDADGVAILDQSNGEMGFGMELKGDRIYFGGHIEYSGTGDFLIAIMQNDVGQYILPLTLAGFRARLQGEDALVQWNTEAEVNTSHFDLERSTNGSGFTSIARISAAGNAGTADYSFLDKNIIALNTTTVFYRLKMVDGDGKFSYSNTTVVQKGNMKNVLRVYPNPATHKAVILVTVAEKQRLTCNIHDNNGRVVQSKTVAVTEGTNSIDVNISSLPAGVYSIQFKEINATTRIVK